MFCPHCGYHIAEELAGFCPNCGRKLPQVSTDGQHRYRHREDIQPGRQKASKKSNTIVIATIFVVLVLVFFFLSSALNFDDESSLNKKVEVQMITDDTYFELSGDFLFEREVFSVYLTDDEKIAFALNDEVASNYDYYSWWLFDRDHFASTSTLSFIEYKGVSLEKTEPVLYYLLQKPGVYDISVDCYVDSDGKRDYVTTYSGTVSYVGYITKEYSWKYKGVQYDAEVTFKYDEYRYYRDLNVNSRAVANYGRVISFITYEEPAVVDLAISLLITYGIDRDITGQEFASFLLAFVQICFEYPPYSNSMVADEYQYGQTEYFAYPLETIFYGMGDCEDTSILLAALYKVFGFRAGIVTLPGHAVAAVGLDVYDPGRYSSYIYEILSDTIDGITYYGCETTVSTPLEIGLVRVTGEDGHPYSWYIGKNNNKFHVF